MNVNDATEQEKAEIKIIHEEFHMMNLDSGQEKVKKLKQEFIPVINEKIGDRFANVSLSLELIAFLLLTPR